MLKATYSQHKQDLRAIDFFNEKNKLFYLDIGANDGVIISNTYLFEKKYNWDGICSEPLPSQFELLKQNRDAKFDNNAVYSESNLQLEFSVHRWLSGLTTHIQKNQIETLNKPKIIVNTITLQDLLKKHNAPKTVHYVSLDTEGSELEILNSVDLNMYKFLYICVEHNYDINKRNGINQLLVKNGYIHRGNYVQDAEYIHETTISGKYYINNDITKEITISRLENNEFMAESPHGQNLGIFNPNTMEIKWNGIGVGKLYYDCIKFDEKNVWSRNY
jgi:FkbM family methyltransferase